jgi:hypothetical protein
MSGHSDMPPEFFDADEPDNPMTQEEFNAISADLGTPADWDRREADALDATGDWGDMLRAAELRTRADLMDALAKAEAKEKLARFSDGPQKGSAAISEKAAVRAARTLKLLSKVMANMNPPAAFPLPRDCSVQRLVTAVLKLGAGEGARAAKDRKLGEGPELGEIHVKKVICAENKKAREMAKAK